MAERSISASELAAHGKAGDLWLAINGDVYDVSKFAKLHPGGAKVLEELGGKDVTEEFYELHRHDVLKKYERLKVGRLEGSHVQITTGSHGVPFAEIPAFQGQESPFYNESHRKFMQAMQDFVSTELVPIAATADLKGEYPSRDLQRKLGGSGVMVSRMGPGEWMNELEQLGLQLPGGVNPKEIDYFHESIAHQEIARIGLPGFVDSLGAGFMISAPAIHHFGTDEMRQKICPQLFRGEKWSALAISEPFAGSDVAAVKATATKTPDGKHFIVNGVKKWITEGAYADYFVTAVRTGGPGGKGISLLLVERGEGVTTTQMSTTYSKCAGTALIVMDDVKVPVTNLLGKENQGFKLISGQSIHFHAVAAGLQRYSSATKRWAQCCEGSMSDTQPTRRQKTGGLLGQRIGEASHPGPSGSRRTIRKRKEKVQAQSLHQTLLQLLLPFLQPIIQDIIQDLLANFLRTGGSTTATPHTLDFLQLFKGLGTTSTQGKSKGKSKQKSTTTSQSPAKPEQPQTQPPQQNTQHQAPDKPTRGKGKGTGNQPPPLDIKGAGKSIQPDPAPTDPSPDTWVTVARKKPNLQDWSIRDKDWDAPTIQYQKLADTIQTHDPTTPFRAVVQTDSEDQAQAAKAMLTGIKSSAVLILWRFAKGNTQIPGQCGNKTVLQRVQNIQVHTEGQLPKLKRCTSEATATMTRPTVVMRVIFDKDYCTTNLWHTVQSQPRKAMQQWTQYIPTAAAASIQDTWGWKQETHGNKHAVVGLLRVEGTYNKAEAPDKILRASGLRGVFIEPMRWEDPLPPIKVQWRTKTDAEPHQEYIQQLLDAAPCWGLARGTRHLGIRAEATTATQPTTRQWQLQQVPQDWTASTIQHLLSAQPDLDDVQVLRHAVRRHQATWWFTAVTAPDVDCIPVYAQHEEQQHQLWARPAAPRTKPRPTQTRTIWDKSSTHWIHSPQTKSGDTKATPYPHGSQALQPTTGEETTRKPDRPEGEEPPAKKIGITTRSTPAGFTFEACLGDGACLFHALAKGLTHTTAVPMHSRQVRAEIAAHFTKHHQRYADLWDHKNPDDAPGTTFDAYIQAIQDPKAWGGYLELMAAARHFNHRIYIVPENVDEEIMVFHDTDKAKATIVLWWNGKHYDWLKPTDDIPEDFAKHTTQPQQGMRGGSQTHTQWTNTSARSGPATVFTQTTRPSTRLRTKTRLPPSEPTAQPTEDTTNAHIEDEPDTDTSEPTHHPAPARTKVFLRQTKGHTNSFFIADNTIAWHCPLCAFAVEHPITEDTPKQQRNKLLNKVYRSKANHIYAFHRDQGAALSLRNDRNNNMLQLQHLEPSEPGWHCDRPNCTIGIPARLLHQFSSTKIRELRWKHAKQAHGARSRKLWGQQQRKTGITHTHSRARSVQRRNAGLSHAISQLPASKGEHSLQPIPLPRWRPKTRTIEVPRSWICTKCHRMCKQYELKTHFQRPCTPMGPRDLTVRRIAIARLEALATSTTHRSFQTPAEIRDMCEQALHLLRQPFTQAHGEQPQQ